VLSLKVSPWIGRQALGTSTCFVGQQRSVYSAGFFS
jgi:hypothetical protein